MKYCPRCERTKPLDDFRPQTRRGKPGRQSYCRACQIDYNREYRARRSEPGWLVGRHKNRDPAALRAQKRKWQLDNPEKVLAHKRVEYAVRRGYLVRPGHCDRCGRPCDRPHAHHEDYNAPLDVGWLCPPCHGSEHYRQKKTILEAA